MNSSYNTPCTKHKTCDEHQYSNTETSLAMSTLAVWGHVVRSRDFSAPGLDKGRLTCDCVLFRHM